MGYIGVITHFLGHPSNLGFCLKIISNWPSLWDSRIRICLKMANLRVFLMVSLDDGPKLSLGFRMNQKLFTKSWGVSGGFR